MGISGLLPLLKEIQVPRKIEDFRGKRLAVDAYVWLHKGAFGCAEDLMKGRKTTRFVDYAMHRVGMLRHWGITPYVVFDGGPLPAKRGTEDSRAKSRADYMVKAQAFEAQGRWRDARDCYTKCIDITPEMAYQLIKALRAENVDYVVAPYEADAQLCFLEREGYVDGVITEDSDLLVFGCKTVIFKLDKDGTCVSIDGTRMAMVRELPMHGWTGLEFRRMAMLSGCDYLPSIPGIGLKKAHKMLRRYKTVEKSLQALRLEGAHTIPPGYAAAFSKAELAFLYQRVFCPDKRRLVTLSELPDAGLSEDEEKWVGLDVDVEVAQGMASGDLHPESRQPIEDQWPEFRPIKGMFCKSKADGTAPRAGTLDGLFKPVKRTKSMPSVPVPRIGELASGPTRLSDMPTKLDRRVSDPSPATPPPKAGKVSKFFSTNKEDSPGPEVDEAAYNLQWEESVATTVASPDHVRSPSPETLPSPPHSLSALAHTPVKPAMEGHFTSPASEHSDFSSPPRSSPPHSRLDHEAEPSSPTPDTRILVMESSQMMTCATVATTPMPSSEDDSLNKISHYNMSKNVLVPASSPFAPPKRVMAQSSDSAADDDIVTPTPAHEKLFRNKGFPTVKRIREPEPEDTEAAERARKVAEGWRQRYALGGSSPGPASVPRPKLSKPRRSMPVTVGAGILTSRSVNVPEPAAKVQPRSNAQTKARVVSVDAPKVTPMAEPRRTLVPSRPAPSKKPRAAEAQAKAATTSASNPCGLTWAALERFRFAGN